MDEQLEQLDQENQLILFLYLLLFENPWISKMKNINS